MPVLVYCAHNLTRERIVFPLALVPTAAFGAILPGFSTAENLLSRVGSASCSGGG
jgi:hypothetical protein